MNIRASHIAERHRGFVLVIVMIVIAMLSLAGLSYVWTLSTENKATHLHGDQLQLEQTLASGQEYVRAVTASTWEQRRDLGDVFDNETLFRQVVLDCDSAGTRQARFSIVSPRSGQVDGQGYCYGLQDESTKLNLAVLQQWEQAERGAAERALIGLPGMTEPIAAAILDWIDTDSTPRSSGAEAEYYARQGLPYVPRDGVPASLEELLLVRDVSRYQLFGGDADRNYQVDAYELQAASGETGGDQPWANVLTMYSAERNVTCGGQQRIDVNQDDLQQLHDQLSEAFDATWATFVVAYRQFGPLAGNGDPSRNIARLPSRGRRGASGPVRSAVVQGEGKPPQLDLSVPARFRLDSLYDLIDARVALPAEDAGRGGRATRGSVARRKSARSRPEAPELTDSTEPPDQRILESPFASDPASMGKYLPTLLDRLALDDSELIRGRINIQRASREVIAAIPGMELDSVDRILTARMSHENDEIASLRHCVWLATDEILDLEQMRRLSPYITGGGDVFRCQVVAALDDSRQIARAELVVDATVSPPRQLYWKDLGMLGPGFPPDVVGVAAAGESAGQLAPSTDFP
jgi:type II secretory pathway component PulK